MDWMEQERERGITITSAATTASWDRFDKKYRVNIIDTPGHVDFTVKWSVRSASSDGAVAIFDSVAGVQPQSETVWRQADKLPRAAPRLVNKMDKMGADFDHVIRTCACASARIPVALQFPLGREDNFLDVSTSSKRTWLCGSRIRSAPSSKFFPVSKLWDAAFVAGRPDVAAALKVPRLTKSSMTTTAPRSSSTSPSTTKRCWTSI